MIDNMKFIVLNKTGRVTSKFISFIRLDSGVCLPKAKQNFSGFAPVATCIRWVIWDILQAATPSIHPGKQHMLVWTLSPITDAQESSTQLKSHVSRNECVNQDSDLTLPVKATVQGNP